MSGKPPTAVSSTTTAKANRGFFQMLKETAQGISNSVGKLPEEFNDPAYEEQKAKIEELKNQVTNLQRYTMRMVFRMRELSVIMTELGVACNIYAEIEQDKIANSFRRVGDANDKIGMMTGEHASVVEQELDAVLQENVLMLNAIGDLFTNRQNAIVALQTTRGTHQGKLKQYETVKGDPRKTGRAHELAREIAEAEEDEKRSRANYDLIKVRDWDVAQAQGVPHERVIEQAALAVAHPTLVRPRRTRWRASWRDSRTSASVTLGTCSWATLAAMPSITRPSRSDGPSCSRTWRLNSQACEHDDPEIEGCESSQV